MMLRSECDQQMLCPNYEYYTQKALEKAYTQPKHIIVVMLHTRTWKQTQTPSFILTIAYSMTVIPLIATWNIIHSYNQTSSIRCTKSQNLMFLVSSCSCLCPNHWSQVLSWEWRCSWSSATGNAPTTSEWSTILLPTKVQLILEIRWVNQHDGWWCLFDTTASPIP